MAWSLESLGQEHTTTIMYPGIANGILAEWFSFSFSHGGIGSNSHVGFYQRTRKFNIHVMMFQYVDTCVFIIASTDQLSLLLVNIYSNPPPDQGPRNCAMASHGNRPAPVRTNYGVAESFLFSL